MKQIYVSSTYNDLVEYRTAVYKALRKMGHNVICMEDYVAKDQRTLARCKEDVAASDLYIGIFAWRYGCVPTEENPNNLSITELEYREAGKIERTTSLVFLLENNVPWLPQMMDSVTGENEGGKRIEQLRSELQKHSPALFKSPDDLATQVIAAVYQDEATKRVSNIRLFDDSQSLSAALSMVPTSELPDIDGMINEARKADIVQINLGYGKSWWTTRLHLTAALATDFKEIQQISFVDGENHLVGMYSPDQVRHALARAFPIIEIAYLQSNQPTEAQGDVKPNDVVFSVGAKLSELSGGKLESDIKEWITADKLQRWMARMRSADRVELRNQPQTLLQHEIISCNSKFVALVEADKLVRIVDRTSMATRIARSIVEEQFR